MASGINIDMLMELRTQHFWGSFAVEFAASSTLVVGLLKAGAPAWLTHQFTKRRDREKATVDFRGRMDSVYDDLLVLGERLVPEKNSRGINREYPSGFTPRATDLPPGLFSAVIAPIQDGVAKVYALDKKATMAEEQMLENTRLARTGHDELARHVHGNKAREFKSQVASTQASLEHAVKDVCRDIGHAREFVRELGEEEGPLPRKVMEQRIRKSRAGFDAAHPVYRAS